MPELTTLFGGGAAIAIIVSLWDKVKFVFSRITGLIFVSVAIDKNIYKSILLYCSKNLKKYKFQPLTFSAVSMFVKPVKKVIKIGYQTNAIDRTLFFRKIYPFIISCSSAGTSGNAPATAAKSNQNFATITFIRGTFDISKIISESLDIYNDNVTSNGRGSRFYTRKYFGRKKTIGEGGESPSLKSMEGTVDSVASDFFIGDKIFLKWNPDDLGEENTKEKKLKTLAFPEEVSGFIEEIKRWHNSKDWYLEKSIPWKRGYLMHGVPGVGKSALITAIGQYLDLPIIIFDLSTMDNSEFYNYWKEMLSRTPCIALIEDIDGVFKGRENINKTANNQGLSFDCFLNCISGVENSDGVLLMITTNKVEDLDEALGRPRSDKHINGTHISTRPGRIDRVLELPLLDQKCRTKIAERILCDFPKFIEKTVEDGEGDTGAQFQERCSQIALREYWENKT